MERDVSSVAPHLVCLLIVFHKGHEKGRLSRLLTGECSHSRLPASVRKSRKEDALGELESQHPETLAKLWTLPWDIFCVVRLPFIQVVSIAGQ